MDTKWLLTVVLAIVSGTQLSYSQAPVPSRPPGFTIKASSSPWVVLEIFYDHLCVDSKGNWPLMKQILPHYSAQNVEVKMHIFPLPYHHNAFFVEMASVMVRRMIPAEFSNFVDVIFDKQDDFLSGAVNMTELEVKGAIAALVSSKLPIKNDDIMKAFTDPTVDHEARYAWKYAASRSITGTAQFIVNGVIVPDAPDYTFDEWTTFLDALLKSQYDKEL